MDKELAKIELMRGVNARLDHAAERLVRVNFSQIIPDAYFSAASAECVHTFVWGEFYSCITLCQSVAEGLARFLASTDHVAIGEDHLAIANRLQREDFISPQAYAAFRRIRREPKPDRNEYHHLTETVEQDYFKLEARAEECLNALYEIESEVFAYTLDNVGCMVPTNLQYWPKGSAANEIQVYMRSGH